MIYTAIYKLKIKKEAEKLFNLWGQELIDLQEKYIKSIEKMLGRWYKATLDELAKNTEVQYNDLFIDQKQFLQKEFTQNDFAIYSKMMKDGFNVWAKQLNKAFKKDINITTTFGIDPADALRYANKYAWDRIKGVDDYSKKRINALVSQGIEKGWWYKKLAEELQRDYSFSTYRARLIATQEIWEAYLNGKDMQFNRYALEYGQKGWKKWVSHRDQRTTDGCLANDNQGWIPYDQEFQSWHAKPTRFVWCRCNCVYRLFDPREDNLTTENETPVDTEQTIVPTYDEFNEWIKPKNYDDYSTQILPAKYFNAIWEQATYIKPKGRAYYSSVGNTINVWEYKEEFEKQWVEVHEVWHFFFTRKVLKDENNFKHFKTIFKDSIAEMKELIKDKKLRYLFNPHTSVWEIWKTLYKEFDEISKINAFTMELIEKELRPWRSIELVKLSPEFQKKIWAFMDTIWALNKEATVWWWHGKSYYKNSSTIFTDWLAKITEKQAQEYFAHLNEHYWIWNEIIDHFLPKTAKAMKEFYKNIGINDFI